jgi:hypothetical protein
VARALVPAASRLISTLGSWRNTVLARVFRIGLPPPHRTSLTSRATPHCASPRSLMHCLASGQRAGRKDRWMITRCLRTAKAACMLRITSFESSGCASTSKPPRLRTSAHKASSANGPVTITHVRSHPDDAITSRKSRQSLSQITTGGAWRRKSVTAWRKSVASYTVKCWPAQISSNDARVSSHGESMRTAIHSAEEALICTCYYGIARAGFLSLYFEDFFRL